MRALVAILVVVLCVSCNQPTPEAAEPATSTAAANPPQTGVVRFPADSPQLRRIKVEAVASERTPLEEVVAPGKIEAIPSRIARVTMPAAGRVKRLMVGLGDAVRAGQVLLTIESPEAGTAISNLQQAEARVQQSHSGVAKAEADLSRVRDLLEHRAIAQKEVVSAEAALAQARSEMAQAISLQHEAEQRLQILGVSGGSPEIPVKSPVSGKVLEVAVAAGEYRTDTSAPLITVADLSTVYVTANVPESAIRLIAIGELIELRLSAWPGETFKARVARIADTVNPETRTIRVMAQLANPSGKLRPDMFGEIRHEETFRVVPIVPQGAVVQKQNQSMVWRERSVGVFEAVPVEIGTARNGRVPITSGISNGDRVVVDGSTLLDSGS
ncbi:MAG TPA: efflux RND transporter periplasmic adaptor subunit [Bryobacteraceae bacterium]|nr:efflux RND transporter periplasmic adaptor subunit [Bryobacteraceae bacterium]